MNAHYYGVVEMVFTGAVVLGLAGWQLWAVRRDIARDRKARSEERAGHLIGEHRQDKR